MFCLPNILASEELAKFDTISTTDSDLISMPESYPSSTTLGLQQAYEEACSRGSKQNYRIHLAVIGHSEAGKTSFIDKLLGKEFQEHRQSTEGIHTRFVTSFFNKNGLGSKTWTEMMFEANILEKDFHESVLEQGFFKEFKTSTSESQRKVQDWLQSIPCTAGEPFVVKGSSPPRLSDSVHELNHPVLRDIGHSENDLYSKNFPEVNSKMKSYIVGENAHLDSISETDTDNQSKEKNAVPESSAIPTIAKISSEELAQLLESLKSYTKPSAERIPYSLNIWDHGGQNEFIMTNQLFLSVEAFILMVMDISLDLNIPLIQSSDAGGKFGIPKTPAQILCYWLNALHILAVEKTIEPNIALVLTHKDMIKADDTKQYIDSYFEELLECIRGKQYASYITVSNIYIVDNRQGTEDDFTQIRNKILAQMTKQKSWGLERPTRWLKLEVDILQKAKDIDKPYLHISCVKDLASAFAINEKELKSFLSFHHGLGDLIYYPDQKLSDIVVTNPQWLLDMFKTLITPHEFLDRRHLKPEILEELKRAIVSEGSLKAVWKGNDVQFLKDVMIKFDLMLPLGSEQKDKEYLVPCMLPAQEVKIGGPDPFTGMALIYNSTLESKCGDAMPVGAFHKLLSQCSKTPGWTVCSGDHLSYTQALIEIDDGVHIELRLQKSKSIEVSIWSFREKLDDGYLSVNEARTLITKAHKTTSKCMKIAGLTQKGSFKMLCPHWNPGEKYVCLVTVDEKKEVPQNMPIFLSYTKKCTMHRKELKPGHFPWTKKDFDYDGKF